MRKDIGFRSKKQVGFPDCICGSSMLGALKKGGVLDWTCGLSPCGALKTRMCSALDSWIVPAWILKKRRWSWLGLWIILTSGVLKTRWCWRLDSWIVPAWSPKNKEVFRIGLMDHPLVLFRISPASSLKNGEGVSNCTQIICLVCWQKAIIRPHWESQCLQYVIFFLKIPLL